jgi:hypothetical protein
VPFWPVRKSNDFRDAAESVQCGNGGGENLKETTLVNSTSQRMNPDILFDCLISTFAKSAIGEFRKFVANHPMVTKWMIASDLVINESQAASDAYTFTLFPCNAEIQDLKAKIVKFVPKDFKKTKTVKPKLHEFLRSGETFTICLLTPKKYNVAGDIRAVRLSLDETLKVMRNWHNADAQKEVIKAFERLKERAKANNFKTQLISTMMIATVMAAFCAIILAQERKIEIVGWFPDRDNITTSYERIADQMFAVNFSAFCQKHNIDERSIKTAIGLPGPDAANPKQTWYDELVRIPDFVAGPLAGWDYKKSLVTGRQKYVEILQGAVADNPYLITLLLTDTAEGTYVHRLLCSKDPLPNARPQCS